MITLGLSTALGAELQALCAELHVPSVEYLVRLHKRDGWQGSVSTFYRARHAALLEVGTTFYIFGSRKRAADIEDLVVRLRTSKRHYVVYGLEADVVESYPGVADGKETKHTSRDT